MRTALICADTSNAFGVKLIKKNGAFVQLFQAACHPISIHQSSMNWMLFFALLFTMNTKYKEKLLDEALVVPF